MVRRVDIEHEAVHDAQCPPNRHRHRAARRRAGPSDHRRHACLRGGSPRGPGPSARSPRVRSCRSAPHARPRANRRGSRRAAGHWRARCARHSSPSGSRRAALRDLPFERARATKIASTVSRTDTGTAGTIGRPEVTISLSPPAPAGTACAVHLIEPSGQYAVDQLWTGSPASAKRALAARLPRGHGTPQVCPSCAAGGAPSSQTISASRSGGWGALACASRSSSDGTAPVVSAP